MSAASFKEKKWHERINCSGYQYEHIYTRSLPLTATLHLKRAKNKVSNMGLIIEDKISQVGRDLQELLSPTLGLTHHSDPSPVSVSSVQMLLELQQLGVPWGVCPMPDHCGPEKAFVRCVVSCIWGVLGEHQSHPHLEGFPCCIFAHLGHLGKEARLREGGVTLLCNQPPHFVCEIICFDT